MGRKPGRSRQHLSLYLAGLCLLTALASAGCRSLEPLADDRRSVFDTPDLAPTPDEPIPSSAGPEDRIEAADGFLRSGRYEEAIRTASGVLDCCRQRFGDRALYVMGLALAHPDNPAADDAEALRRFERIPADYPGSPYAVEARAWTSSLERLVDLEARTAAAGEEIERLKQEVRKRSDRVRALREQIELLKAVDLETEQGAEAVPPEVP